MHDNKPIDKPKPLLEVKHLSMVFGGFKAVDDLSFTVYEGQILSIIGPNGAGKTTLFNCITGFYVPTSGMMVMRTDHELTYLERSTDYEINRVSRIARTFQNIRLFLGMTVLENVLVGVRLDHQLRSSKSFSRLSSFWTSKATEEAMLDAALYWLKLVGLLERANDLANDLSYGEQRRLEIARAMGTRPLLLCLDEPAAGLNTKESAELNDVINTIRTKEGTSILLIEHDMTVVMKLSDRVIVMNHGVNIAEDVPRNIVKNPKVISAYLGDFSSISGSQ